MAAGEWQVLSAEPDRFVRWRRSDDGWIQFSVITPGKGGEPPRVKETGFTPEELASVVDQTRRPS